MMPNHGGYFETEQQIAERWARWCKQADEIERQRAAQAEQETITMQQDVEHVEG